MTKSREQHLVDICFALVLTATSPSKHNTIKNASQDEKTEWVRSQLNGCGFEVEPCGASHGVLKEESA